ncbi:hypothetical protein LOAG_04756 [Loa loa]|uniref:Uncharacterized protein n=1 Tax=Loa loa TaxID=7209 RepID=A0A1S0U1Q4_LOALO|nr:hypothetical protein LOAG_04756 [Loa loa]EFO23727.2 hypothetical protein LOAG_04756 [Loa loa]
MSYYGCANVNGNHYTAKELSIYVTMKYAAHKKGSMANKETAREQLELQHFLNISRLISVESKFNLPEEWNACDCYSTMTILIRKSFGL